MGNEGQFRIFYPTKNKDLAHIPYVRINILYLRTTMMHFKLLSRKPKAKSQKPKAKYLLISEPFF